MTAKILALAGSTRAASFNKRLLAIAAAAAEDAGAEVTRVDLRDLPMPLYDGDLEAADGLPAAARELKALFVAHQGLLIASPEYNSSFSGVLKNAIDWISRPQPDEPPLVAFERKVAGLMSASPGALGGLRGLVHLRQLLGNIRVLVIPEQLAVPAAMKAIGDDGQLVDARHQATLEGIAHKLVEVTARLHAG